MEPEIIRKEELIIAGVSGDGSKTAALWEEFNKIEDSVENRSSDHGYEVRIYRDDSCRCHVGVLVSDTQGNENLDLLKLPPSEYAIFEVLVVEGYDSQNEVMDRWIEDNTQGYVQSKLDGDPFVVEHYDERFKEDEPDSIVEIWVPIERS